EDAVGAPAVVVGADQGAGTVGRQRRLTGAGEAEEDRAITLRAYICRAMHREYAAGRQHEIEIAEHRLLDLAGVAGAADQHEARGEIDQDEGLRADAVELGDREEIRGMQDREGRPELHELRLRRAGERRW